MLTGAHLHLLVNHVPILGALFALGLLLASFLWAPDVLRKTALVVLIGVAVAGVIADKSGDPAEKAIQGFPGVSRDRIHAHEDAAGKAYLTAGLVGVLALGILIRWRREPVPAGATAAALAGAVLVSGLMGYTGLLGGRVRHTEVRPGASSADAMTIEPPRPRRPAPPAQP